MIESLREDEKVSPEAKKLEERNLFCINMADHMNFLIDWTEVDLPIDPGGKLGQFSQSDHGGGHGHPWKGRRTPPVPVVKAEARGSEWLSSDCSQSGPLSCLPNGFDPCGQSSDSESTHETTAPSSQACLEGQTEHRDGKLRMVTSALFMKLLAQGSV
jgi:hypothetical protein